MKTLILGGTGAIGQYLHDYIDGDVYITTRKERLSNDRVRFLQVDAMSITDLEPVLNLYKWDAIIDLMAYNTEEFSSRYKKLLHSTNHYIYVSTARVYSESRTITSETHPRLIDNCTDEKYLETDEYALCKARQENILTESDFVNWTIVRPYITYSDSRLQLGPYEKEGWLYRALAKKKIIMTEHIFESYTTITRGEDVARGIASLVGLDETKTDCYNITNSVSLKWRDVFEIYRKELESHNVKLEIQFVSNEVLKKAHPSPYQITYDRNYNRYINNDKLSKFTDVNRFELPEQGLRLALKAFLNRPTFNNIHWNSEAVKDQITDAHQIISEISGYKQKFRYILTRYLRNNVR